MYFVFACFKQRLYIISMLNKAIIFRKSVMTVYADITYGIECLGTKEHLVAVKFILVEVKCLFILKIFFADPSDILFVKSYKGVVNKVIIHKVEKITTGH